MFKTYEVQENVNVMVASEQQTDNNHHHVQIMTQMVKHPNINTSFVQPPQHQNDHKPATTRAKSNRGGNVPPKLHSTVPNSPWAQLHGPVIPASIIQAGKIKTLCYQQQPPIMDNTVMNNFPKSNTTKYLLPIDQMQHGVYVNNKNVPVHCPQTIKTEIKSEIKVEIKDEPSGSSSESPYRRLPHLYEVNMQNLNVKKCLQYVLQDHNYGAPPPRTPSPHLVSPKQQQQQHLVTTAPTSSTNSQILYTASTKIEKIKTNLEDDANSAISSEPDREVELEGEETETAPEGEDEDSITRCICDFEHDDGYMICCDRCLVWQHVDCMGIDRNKIPDEYLCEICQPRRVDRQRARNLQLRKREESLNSDSSSSSSSSADTKPPSNQSQQRGKKASHPGRTAPRRKSESSSQGRKVNNNNNNITSGTTTKRKRAAGDKSNTNNNSGGAQKSSYATRKKDLDSSQTASVQKKSQRGEKPGSKKRTLSVGSSDDGPDSWNSSDASLRQWIDKYEEAVTNHYSPELRSRILNLKTNGLICDYRQANINASSKCRVNIQSRNLRFLVAATSLPPTSPIIELRGKYMLGAQYKSSHVQGRQHQNSKQPGPFVFFYRLPRDGLEVCVDTRTYGNDARFVRRSCRPNAEVKHCIEKGTLHLYVVSSCTVEKNEEITIAHDRKNFTPPAKTTLEPLPCACNNPKTCQMTSASSVVNNQTPESPVAPTITTTTNKKGCNGAITPNNERPEKRQRSSRTKTAANSNTNTTSANAPIEPVNKTLPPSQSPVPATASKTPITRQQTQQQQPQQNQQQPPINPEPVAVSTSSPISPTPVSQPVSTPDKNDHPHRQSSPEDHHHQYHHHQQLEKSSDQSPRGHEQPSKKDKRKMTREERKMEAIMKAFERLEKAEQRKQEAQARNAQRRESTTAQSDNEGSSPQSVPQRPRRMCNEKNQARRKRRKGRLRSVGSSSQSSSIYKSVFNSAESDLTSGDETMMTSSGKKGCYSPLKGSGYLTRNLGLRQGITSSDVNTIIGFNTDASPTANNIGVGQQQEEQKMITTPVKSPLCDSGASSSSQSSTPCTPLSSACLLVAAAVGPLAPGFKFPKTKKVLMNEWLKESPDVVSTSSQGPTDLSQSVSENLSSSNFGCQSSDHHQGSVEVLGQNFENNFSGAGSKCVGNSSSSPVIVDLQTGALSSGSAVNRQNFATADASRDSAKKRWLRQAISEECDSPSNSGFPETSNETVIPPPKKRRTARESLSSDYTPPTTPTGLFHMDQVPAVKQENESDSTDHLPAISLQQIKVELPEKEELVFKSEPKTEAVKVETKTESYDEPDKKVISDGRDEVDFVQPPVRTHFDELDFEAQMKKITGDDGNYYGDKNDVDYDKSDDAIEVLMSSSPKDQAGVSGNQKSSNFGEEVVELEEESNDNRQLSDNINSLIEEMESSTSLSNDGQLQQQCKPMKMEVDQVDDNATTVPTDLTETSEDRSKLLSSIPPLSERIRKRDKKTDELQSALLSSAFREILEAKIEADDIVEPKIVPSPPLDELPPLLTNAFAEPPPTIVAEPEDKIGEAPKLMGVLLTPKKEDPPPPVLVKEPQICTTPVASDIVRRKDPRTVSPKKITAPVKVNSAPCIKRKLSISEYRQRKQQTSCPPKNLGNSVESATSDKNTTKCKLNGASSSSSAFSSDDEESKILQESPILSTLPSLDVNSEEKKGVNEEKIGWSAAPTLVERQRENLTERLKREFGLFLTEDEEERQKQISGLGLTQSISGTIDISQCQNSQVVFGPPEAPPGSNPYPPQILKTTINSSIDNISAPLPVPKPVSPPSRK